MFFVDCKFAWNIFYLFCWRRWRNYRFCALARVRKTTREIYTLPRTSMVWWVCAAAAAGPTNPPPTHPLPTPSVGRSHFCASSSLHRRSNSPLRFCPPLRSLPIHSGWVRTFASISLYFRGYSYPLWGGFLHSAGAWRIGGGWQHVVRLCHTPPRYRHPPHPAGTHKTAEKG